VTAPYLERWAPEDSQLAPGWRPAVDRFFESDAGRKLSAFLRERIDTGAVIYPPRPLRALEVTPLSSVHAVILGQDPYHGPGQAEGLAFSVPAGVKLPPSLRNIYKELYCDAPASAPASGSLLAWAQGGVLLLNAVLTVEDGRPGSHAKMGWELLTDALLAEVAANCSPCVYLLWGAYAQAKAELIERTSIAHGREALVLQSNHPSPLSASRPPVPFIGCGHFRTAREWLGQRGIAGVL
jgi:uracil-DNA glycosylase